MKVMIAIRAVTAQIQGTTPGDIMINNPLEMISQLTLHLGSLKILVVAGRLAWSVRRNTKCVCNTRVLVWVGVKDIRL